MKSMWGRKQTNALFAKKMSPKNTTMPPINRIGPKKNNYKIFFEVNIADSLPKHHSPSKKILNSFKMTPLQQKTIDNADNNLKFL